MSLKQKETRLDLLPVWKPIQLGRQKVDLLLHLDNVAAQAALEDGGFPGGHPALHGIPLFAPLEELVVDLLPETLALLHLLPPGIFSKIWEDMPPAPFLQF